MKKIYSGMDAVEISFDNNDILTAGTSNCVLVTQLETAPGGSPCGLTDPDFWQEEWYGDNTWLNS